jgi:hypothetical protein
MNGVTPVALTGEFAIAGRARELRSRGARFRSEIIAGVGGKQILLEAPSGNPIELFEPTRPEAWLPTTS